MSTVPAKPTIFTNELLSTSRPRFPLLLNAPVAFTTTSELCPANRPLPALPLLVQLSSTTLRLLLMSIPSPKLFVTFSPPTKTFSELVMDRLPLRVTGPNAPKVRLRAPEMNTFSLHVPDSTPMKAPGIAGGGGEVSSANMAELIDGNAGGGVCPEQSTNRNWACAGIGNTTAATTKAITVSMVLRDCIICPIL